MNYEFEGKTEQEAVDKAVAELQIGADNFDVEILEEKKGLFKRGVRIRVHLQGTQEGNRAPKSEAPAYRERGNSSTQGSEGGTTEDAVSNISSSTSSASDKPLRAESLPGSESMQEVEEGCTAFLEGLLEKMQIEGTAQVTKREQGKVVISLNTDNNARIIGKGGKTLDAIQSLTGCIANKTKEYVRVVVDAGNYREESEDKLVQRVYQIADRVKSSGKPYLFEAMGPYERRIIHVTLADIVDIKTESQGDGLYKRVRVSRRGY